MEESRFNVLEALLSSSVFLYILSIFWVESLPGWSRLVHLSLVFMLGCLMLKGWRQGLKLRLEPVLALFWIFFTFAYLSIYWSTDRTVATVSTVSLLINILGGTLVWVALWNGIALTIVGYAAVAGATVQASFALIQFWSNSGEILRFEGLTGNANALAIQLSIAAFLALATLRRSFWPPFLAIVFVLAATLLSGSRKIAFVWFVLVLLLLRYIGVRFRSSSLFRIGLLLGLPLVIYMAVSYSNVLLKPVEGLYVYERFQATIEGEESSANIREAMIYEGLGLWRESPIWGHGINQFRNISSFSTYSHNNYTELLVSFGLIGFFLYYGGLFILLVRGGLGLFRNAPEAALIGASLTLLFLWDIALVAYSTRLVWLFLSVLGYLSGRKTSESPNIQSIPNLPNMPSISYRQ